jgi:nucleoredoxin
MFKDILISIFVLLVIGGLYLATRSVFPEPIVRPAEKLAGHLVAVKDDHFENFDTAGLKDVKYFAFYFSASWCPPCKVFTPKLVDFYNSFKPGHPDFELILLDQDASQEEMLSYMIAGKMPWPAVRFDAIDSADANKYRGEGIPDLVLVDAQGKVLSDSFDGYTYLGPDKVLDDIKQMVK